jgi:signal transduction histidine kinase
MINHELRTPLTGVVTGAELLRSDGGIDDPTWEAVLDDVIRDGIRLRGMIDQILAVARIENRALFFELDDVPVEEVARRLRQANPRIRTPMEGGLEDVELRTDTTSLVSLVNALAANATTHGASRVELSVRRSLPFEPMLEVGSRPEPAAFFVIEDDGPGIDISFLPRAFEKFEKDSRSSGTGLGLYVARKMAEALDASILVSTSAAGTTFAVAVPVTACAEAAA